METRLRDHVASRSTMMYVIKDRRPADHTVASFKVDNIEAEMRVEE
jgi:hypothetical protein